MIRKSWRKCQKAETQFKEKIAKKQRDYKHIFITFVLIKNWL